MLDVERCSLFFLCMRVECKLYYDRELIAFTEQRDANISTQKVNLHLQIDTKS
jgi:hypothetical protein